MEQLIVILLVAAVAIANKLLNKGDMTDSSDEGSPPFNPPATSRRYQAGQTEEERVRKFMEALGMPPTAMEPQRKVVQQQPAARRAQPRVKIDMSRPVSSLPPVLPQAEPTVLTYEEKPVVAKPTQPREVVVAAPPQKSPSLPTDSRPSPAIDLQTLLKSPASIRTAFLFREILGPPRSLHSFSEATSFR